MFDENDKLIAFVDGMVTDQADLTDEMYEKEHCTMKWCMADDLWCKYHSFLPQKRMQVN